MGKRVWIGSNGPVAYVYSAMGCVQFGFFNESFLKDPKGLLEGEGEYVRHTKVHGASEIDERAFAALLKQASARAKNFKDVAAQQSAPVDASTSADLCSNRRHKE
jgi:hypothetical protein